MHFLIAYAITSLFLSKWYALWLGLASMMIPDFPVFIFGALAVREFGFPPRADRWRIRSYLNIGQRYEEKYPWARKVTSFFHSYVTWCILLILGYVFDSFWFQLLSWAGIIHALADHPVHRRADAHSHLFPILAHPMPGLWSFADDRNGSVALARIEAGAFGIILLIGAYELYSYLFV